MFLIVLCQFSVKNLYWHRGAQKSRTEAPKDNLSEHLGTRHNSYIFEPFKMLMCYKIQKYSSHLADWAKNTFKK